MSVKEFLELVARFYAVQRVWISDTYLCSALPLGCYMQAC